MENETDLKRSLETAFYEPRSSQSWKSARGRLYWSGLEDWRFTIAGPLDSIVTKGNCEYVYARNDQYFAGVHDPGALRSRLLEWHAALASRVERFAPASEAELADLMLMQSLVASMRSLIDHALEVESRRWKNR
jgi:hypothetical protein